MADRPATTPRAYAKPIRVNGYIVAHEDDWRAGDTTAGSTRPWAITHESGRPVLGPGKRRRVFRYQTAAVAAAEALANGR